MITLLDRLAAADRTAGRFPVATVRACELLGWDHVTEQVARHCHDARAAVAVRAQRPYADPDAVNLARTLADELRPLAASGKWPPTVTVSAALDLLEQPAPRRLEGADLIAVARLAEDLDILRDWFVQCRDTAPTWGEAASAQAIFSPLVGEVRRCLDRDGHLLDSASPLLSRLRRVARDREQQVRQSVARAMSEASRRGWATAGEVTLRGDRFCLPLKSGERRKVGGIVHDRSHTGQTVYVEPAETVHLANDLAETRLEMGAEESRLLLALNQHVDREQPALVEAGELMILADRVRAAMLWSEQRHAFRCRLEPGLRPRIWRARHPLLEEALEHAARETGTEPARVIPLDLDLPADKRVLVISGPNAGGKSVAMKTVGVLVMLAQCGWDIPAREDTQLPLVRRLCVDLGDEQSIEDSLSSFSAHLTHLKRYLDEADENTLLILDEVGSGTDPQEGTALALTALETFAARGALVLASTHFGLLKAAVHDHPAMVNAAMDYDEDSLAPMFTLRLGDPGASHAFDIAARVGLDRAMLVRARSLVGEERYQLEQLLEDLARRARDLARRDEEARDRLAGVTRRQEELDARLKGLDRELKQERQAVRRRGEDMLRQARRTLEETVREIRSSGGDRVVIKRARAQIQDMSGALPAGEDAHVPPAGLACGDRVRVPHLGLVGQVTEIRGDKIGVLADGLRLSVDRSAIAALDGQAGPAAETAAPTATAGAWTWDQGDAGIPPELDLRGLRGEEAWDRLDRMLDRALPVGLDQITAVHGMGTGRLRDYLLKRLERDPRVASFHPGGERQNNFGATVIHLH